MPINVGDQKKRLGLGTEVDRRDIVRFALAIYCLGKATGKDPLKSERRDDSS